MNNRIKYYREKKGLSQRELATLADVSNTALSMLEREMSSPNLCTAISLAEALSVRTDQLFPALNVRKGPKNEKT